MLLSTEIQFVILSSTAGRLEPTERSLQGGLSRSQHWRQIQSGRSSLAKHGGAYFSAVYGFMKDPIAAPGPYENQEC